ncbi:DUF2127 domain-containing protein [Pelotalea chapellei]|uniref:DUF2127 domain-containing protein n=1 Tax=Pelotalea chapellei TaxID=44671 RepID=A0ABS5U755_9BACT|nr:DUF2127 domain-containing protein [Pelotalea chapellei]MBT1071495.1 DUF2127 domain-containing protein [Pelotalea chapellei]
MLQKKRRGSFDGIYLVALFEGAKGAIVILAGFGLLSFIHKDLRLAAEQLVTHLHINPAQHYPRIFIDAAGNITNGQLVALALAAMIYSIVRFTEAYGLWKRQAWAEWFGLLSGGIYVPVELFEVLRGSTWPKVSVLIVNLGIVLYLFFAIIHPKRSR